MCFQRARRRRRKGGSNFGSIAFATPTGGIRHPVSGGTIRQWISLFFLHRRCHQARSCGLERHGPAQARHRRVSQHLWRNLHKRVARCCRMWENLANARTRVLRGLKCGMHGHLAHGTRAILAQPRIDAVAMVRVDLRSGGTRHTQTGGQVMETRDYNNE